MRHTALLFKWKRRKIPGKTSPGAAGASNYFSCSRDPFVSSVSKRRTARISYLKSFVTFQQKTTSWVVPAYLERSAGVLINLVVFGESEKGEEGWRIPLGETSSFLCSTKVARNPRNFTQRNNESSSVL